MGSSFLKTIGTIARVGVILAADAAGRKAMGVKADFDALKQDVENMKTAFNGTFERIAAKIAELGEPDPDLNEIRTSIQAETARATSFLASTATVPGSEVTETSPGGAVEPETGVGSDESGSGDE